MTLGEFYDWISTQQEHFEKPIHYVDFSWVDKVENMRLWVDRVGSKDFVVISE